MYINAVADSVMLFLQHDFYKIIFKIKQFHIASGSAAPSPPTRKNSGCAPDLKHLSVDGRIVLRWIFNKLLGLIWLSIGAGLF
jgi:hypothetical protein